MKAVAYCIFFLLLLNPLVVFGVLLFGHMYLIQNTSYAIIASGVLALAWAVAWAAIRSLNSRLDWECRKRMNWL